MNYHVPQRESSHVPRATTCDRSSSLRWPILAIAGTVCVCVCVESGVRSSGHHHAPAHVLLSALMPLLQIAGVGRFAVAKSLPGDITL